METDINSLQYITMAGGDYLTENGNFCHLAMCQML